jgi:hypothetical protein
MASCRSIGSCTIGLVREQLARERSREGASRRIQQRFACARHQLRRQWPVCPHVSPTIFSKHSYRLSAGNRSLMDRVGWWRAAERGARGWRDSESTYVWRGNLRATLSAIILTCRIASPYLGWDYRGNHGCCVVIVRAVMSTLAVQDLVK